MSREKVDYPIPFIRTLLENYDSLRQFQWYESEDGQKVGAHSFRAPFEAAVIAKVDIDSAVDALGRKEQALIRAQYLIGYTLGELYEMFPNDDIVRLEQRAIRNMANYLNGECVLARWCRENGFVDSRRRILIPEDMPKDLAQYIKEICLNYCILDDCPK